MRKALFGFVAVASIAVWAADKPVALNVKTGLWQSTTTISTGGEMPVPSSLLERLTPDQRARLEERMKASSGDRTNTFTEKHCVTKEDLQNGFRLGGTPKEAECTQTILTSTSTKAEVKMVCSIENIKGEGTIEVEASNPENVKGSGHITSSGGGRTMNSSSTFTAKWMGANCGDTK